MLFALRLRPGFVEIVAHDLRINGEKAFTDIAGEGEILVPAAVIGIAGAVEVIVENAANAARLIAMRQEEIFVAPFFVARVIGDRMPFAGAAHRRMESLRVGIVLRAARIEHGRQIGAAAKPRLGGDDKARVHMHGRHIRIPWMRDQRNAGGEKARILGGAGNLLGEFRLESSKYRRTMHAGFFEDAAVDHAHAAAAAGRAIMIAAFPTAEIKASRLLSLGRKGACRCILQRLESSADAQLQSFEPFARGGLTRFQCLR